MKLLLAALALAALALVEVQAAKEVFAHVIVGNANGLSLADWEDDIKLAQAAKIDGFVLNIAAQDTSNDNSLTLAFQAANNLNFKLFFSFDYQAEGPWPQAAVTALIQKHASDPAYFKPDGARPFVSTFEGPGNAADWPAIKSATNAFFVPDWSSVSAQSAVGLAGGVADGLFSFNAWPDGDTNLTTDGDKAFQAALAPGKKVYMMPVAPWFFTNLPGFNKNWLWRGDQLWDARWQQVAAVQPDFVEILTWNDYGESHYIGPVRQAELGLFTSASAPINYASNVSHDGWRTFLPFYIDVYKNGGQIPAGENITEGVVAYYRTAAALACPSGGTTGNNKAFGQTEVPPESLVSDSVFYAALLTSDAGVTVSVAIGGKQNTGVFDGAPAAGRGTPGVYSGSVPFGGATGEVVVTVSRGGQTVGTAQGGKAIAAQCEGGVQNWNAVAV